jgi:hypothetical protein
MLFLGMISSNRYDPILRWKQGCMEIADPRRKVDNVYTMRATSREMLPNVATNHIELVLCKSLQILDRMRILMMGCWR